MNSRRFSRCITAIAAMLTMADTLIASPTNVGPSNRNTLVVTPNGPDDGGDFGPKTPGTKTSGLQEAFLAAKEQGKDLYLSGGSWTADKTTPIVYFLQETLHIPWMQNFRMDGGHCVIHYSKKTGDAIHLDSQMSCYYRFGILVSESDGAVVRMRPDTQGPDRFRVLTTTELHINALVGGGGAWPGGEAHNSTLNPEQRWIGTGLMLDATPGPIDSNKIHVVEIVGCHRAVHMVGACTHNEIDVTLAHLSRTHLEIGDKSGTPVNKNRITAHCDSQGIAGAVGARIFGKNNLLTLSTARTSPGGDVIFEEPAMGNLVIGIQLSNGITNHSTSADNRVIASGSQGFLLSPPAVPASGVEFTHRESYPVEIRIIAPGQVKQWRQTDAKGKAQTYKGPLFAGMTISLEPGDRLWMEYDDPPSWTWKGR